MFGTQDWKVSSTAVAASVAAAVDSAADAAGSDWSVPADVVGVVGSEEEQAASPSARAAAAARAILDRIVGFLSGGGTVRAART
jgi:hypothetical protein